MRSGSAVLAPKMLDHLSFALALAGSVQSVTG